ncbi:rod shape-determining protein, partial [Candidatus Parcubacteria bacterium]|nr:rod shape-determining protein [Candidatus Parcubacteria bacterium]
EREIGTCVLNFGADTTEIAVYKFGKLSFFKILPIGSSFITSRIAIFLKTDFETAERIKIEFGNCFGSSKKQKIEIGENLTLSFTLNSLARVIRESLGKILSEVKKTLKDYFKTQELPGGIVITGGGAKLRGICEFTRKRLSAYTRLGKPNFIFGLDPDPSFSLAVGLILEGLEMEKEFRGEGFFEKLKQFFKNFLP